MIKSRCTFLQFAAALIIIFLSALASTSILPDFKSDSRAFVSAELYTGVIMCRAKQRDGYRKKSRKSNDTGPVAFRGREAIHGHAIRGRAISPSGEIDRIAADRKKLIIVHAWFHRADRGERRECYCLFSPCGTSPIARVLEYTYSKTLV